MAPGGGFLPGSDATGTGAGVNVIALAKACPHLGCRPNPCVEDFWFHCPCHQSRYDRLGIKPAGTQFGPADRSMDRRLFVNSDGELLIIPQAGSCLKTKRMPLQEKGIDLLGAAIIGRDLFQHRDAFLA